MMSIQAIVQEVPSALERGSYQGYYLPDHVITMSIPVTACPDQIIDSESDDKVNQRLEDEEAVEADITKMRVSSDAAFAIEIHRQSIVANNVLPYTVKPENPRCAYYIILAMSVVLILTVALVIFVVVSTVDDE